MAGTPDNKFVHLDVSHPIWERFFTVAPLVVIGTREADGQYDLAPKHMVMPLGWDNFFGFVCTPSHATYRNILREDAFTVSFPYPDQVLLTSLSASPRCEDQSKPALRALPTFPATTIDGVFLKQAYLFFECRLHRVVDGFAKNSLIAGRIVAAQVVENALRSMDVDDRELIERSPLMAYVAPGRYATIDRSFSFPFPEGFQRGDE
jgi:flavin reductase (DIM6/NTAB) family NADH-FMN oxidoreductase RutF